jgi:hypothetical protein
VGFPVVFRYTIFGLSAVVMILGILFTFGVIAPANVSEQFRIIMGTVIFLYGAYRFTVAYFRKSQN